MISINNSMKKSFDQLFNEIVGENLMQGTQQQPQQGQQPQQPAQPANNNQAPNIKELATQLASINKADEIEAILNKLVNPNAANQPA